VCGQAFNTTQDLMEHGKSHLQSSMFVCNVCFHVFANDASLERHMKRHSTDKPFICDLCQKTFARKEHLENHKRIHSGKLFWVSACLLRLWNEQYGEVMIRKVLFQHAQE
jgi:KRAB domain-containing zinc finger protein